MTSRPQAGSSATTRERMLAGELYLADDPEIAEAGARAQDLADAYNATTAREGALRRGLLEELLGSVGEGTEIRPPLSVDYGSSLRIGTRRFVDFGLVALDVVPISIGDDVQIGSNVQLLTHNTVVGAGAVVTRDLPANVVAAGNPARVVRTLDGTGR